MNKVKYLFPLLLLFATGCGVGHGIGSSSSEPINWDEYDLFTTVPSDLSTPQQVTWNTGVIEVDSNFYSLQQFNMTLQENPVDRNSIKLTIDVVTPDDTKQSMTIYTAKNKQ
jgi:hypothetical protein